MGWQWPQVQILLSRPNLSNKQPHLGEAQLAEHGSWEPVVGGSSPSTQTNSNKPGPMAEWHTPRSEDACFAGSTPARVTKRFSPQKERVGCVRN